MRRSAWLCLFVLLGPGGCVGPPAPDAEVCRDAIARLCAAPRCARVSNDLVVDDACAETLAARTGCASDEFAFSGAVTRERFLSCRVALLRAGGRPDQHPDCDDVNESFDRCGDVVDFYKGAK